MNACGHHHVGHIGILGVDKNGEEFYQITLGGDGTETTSLGRIIGPAVSADGVVDAIETLVETYLATRRPGERFVDTYRRLGDAPFKERLYAAA
jgi:sulfite reductase (NADPH) hemoprotein beta-component